MPRSQQARRALAARRRRGEVETRQPAARGGRPAWPSKITVAELDELGERHGVSFEENATKAEKQAALDAAGVRPEG